MKTEHILGIIISFMLVLLVFQYSQINKLKNNAGINNEIDMTGWTENEKMNYEHHGTMPARLSGNTQSSKTDMSGWTESEKMNYEHHGTLPNR